MKGNIKYQHSVRYGHDCDAGVTGEVHSLVISNEKSSLTIDFYVASYGKSMGADNYELAEQALEEIISAYEMTQGKKELSNEDK